VITRTTFALTAVIVCALCSTACALYQVMYEGAWPATWPKELESLRKQATTLEGPQTAHRLYQIPFTKREEFEAAWPHLLKVTTKGAPLFLVRSPFAYMGSIKSGVIVHCPPIGTDTKLVPEAPVPGQNNPRTTWMNTSFLELIVDGDVVDLNRIALPEGTPVIDERFKEQRNKAAGAGEKSAAAPTDASTGKPATDARP
jgi:hypothetical protein